MCEPTAAVHRPHCSQMSRISSISEGLSACRRRRRRAAGPPARRCRAGVAASGAPGHLRRPKASTPSGASRRHRTATGDQPTQLFGLTGDPRGHSGLAPFSDSRLTAPAVRRGVEARGPVSDLSCASARARRADLLFGPAPAPSCAPWPSPARAGRSTQPALRSFTNGGCRRRPRRHIDTSLGSGRLMARVTSREVTFLRRSPRSPPAICSPIAASPELHRSLRSSSRRPRGHEPARAFNSRHQVSRRSQNWQNTSSRRFVSLQYRFFVLSRCSSRPRDPSRSARSAQSCWACCSVSQWTTTSSA